MYAQGRWTPATVPQGTLEGPAHQSLTPVPVRASATNNADTLLPNKDPISALASSIRDIKQAYDLGQITSTAAEGLAAMSFLVDKGTRLWTTGIYSSQWYYFDGGRWNTSSQPPMLHSYQTLAMGRPSASRAASLPKGRTVFAATVERKCRHALMWLWSRPGQNWWSWSIQAWLYLKG